MADHIPTRGEGHDENNQTSATPSFAGAVPGVDTVTSVAAALEETRARLDEAEAVIRALLEQNGYTRKDSSWSAAVRRAYTLLEGGS